MDSDLTNPYFRVAKNSTFEEIKNSIIEKDRRISQLIEENKHLKITIARKDHLVRKMRSKMQDPTDPLKSHKLLLHAIKDEGIKEE